MPQSKHIVITIVPQSEKETLLLLTAIVGVLCADTTGLAAE